MMIVFEHKFYFESKQIFLLEIKNVSFKVMTFKRLHLFDFYLKQLGRGGPVQRDQFWQFLKAHLVLSKNFEPSVTLLGKFAFL